MLYAVAVLPLIHSLNAPGKWTQNWYADDSSCVAELPFCKLGLRKFSIGAQIMATIRIPQRQCWLLVLLMFSRLLNCLHILGLGLFVVDDFWVDLLLMLF